MVSKNIQRRKWKKIDYDGDIDLISKKICNDYQLGTFKSNKLIFQGYDDFNLIFFIQIYTKSLLFGFWLFLFFLGDLLDTRLFCQSILL